MFRKIFLIILAACSLTMTLCIASAASTTFVPKVDSEAYTTANGYKYTLDSLLSGSPDSFEAWIKLPSGSKGGTIMGNFYERGYPYDTINWEVSETGFFQFQWNDKELVYTFDSTTDLRDNTWHHVALVRTSSSFIYYLDGVKKSTYNMNAFECVSEVPFIIGVDMSNWRDYKKPFDGSICQVTLYSGAISVDQIKSDMTNNNITSSNKLSSDTKLLGNWYLGETWSSRNVKSSEANTPLASLQTFNKYVTADYSFGEYDYTFIIMPDIQIMGNYNPDKLENMLKWIVDNKDTHNIKFIVQTGDLSDFGQKPELYELAANKLSVLDNVIPYCFVPGNHDYVDNAGSRNTEYLNQYFPVSKHSELPGFGGVFEEGKIENNYYLFNVMDNAKYLVINMEYHPRKSVLRWAGRLMEEYSDHRVIINTHDWLYPDASFGAPVGANYEANGSQKMFDCLKKYSNLFLAIGGHNPNDDVVKRIDYGTNGNQIISLLVDGQATQYPLTYGSTSLTAEDMILLVHVNEKNKTMNCVYYSPKYGKAWNLQNQFQLSFADEKNPTIGK